MNTQTMNNQDKLRIFEYALSVYKPGFENINDLIKHYKIIKYTLENE